MEIQAVIVDIDGTISDCTHRQHLAEAKQWDAFQELSHLDPPIQPIIDLVNALDSEGWYVFLCTGRNEKYRAKTMMWLTANNVPFDELYMRPDKDFRNDVVYKSDTYKQMKLDYPDAFITMAIEDRDRVVEMWRDKGLVCLQAQKGQY